MSCFVVSSETLDKVVTLALGSDLTMFCGVTMTGSDVAAIGTQLGRRLWQLNNDAFRACYQGRHCDDMVDPETYTYTGPTSRISLDNGPLRLTVARYKALACLTYQLMEDPVVSTTDYAQLEELENQTARRIVGRLPEYDAAPWG